MPYAESHVGVTLDSVLPGEGRLSFIDLGILKANTYPSVPQFSFPTFPEWHDPDLFHGAQVSRRNSFPRRRYPSPLLTRHNFGKRQTARLSAPANTDVVSNSLHVYR